VTRKTFAVLRENGWLSAALKSRTGKTPTLLVSAEFLAMG